MANLTLLDSHSNSEERVSLATQNPLRGMSRSKLERLLEADTLHLRSARTRRVYRDTLLSFFDWLGERAISRYAVQEYASWLRSELVESELLLESRRSQKPLSKSRVNLVLAAVRWYVRQFAEYAEDAESLSESERRAIVRSAGRVSSVESLSDKPTHKAGRVITLPELEALARTCAEDTRITGLRDSALIALAYASGARRAELAELTVESWRPDGVLLHGKGDKYRLVPIEDANTRALVEAWLQARGTESGALFCRVNKSGVLDAERRGLTTEAMAQMLARRAEASGVSGVTWHDFRRTFITTLDANGVSLVVIAELAGHEDVKTTMRYTRPNHEAKLQAARLLRWPLPPSKAHG